MRSGTATLAVGKPSSRPRCVAALDAARAPRAGRPRIAAARSTSPRGEQLADARRRVRDTAVGRVLRLGRRDEPEPSTSKPSSAPMRCSSGDVAVAAVAEVEVGADHDEPRAEHAGEHLAHEVFGRLLAARLVEREHEALVDRAGGLEQLELLFERREQLRRRSGPHDLGRVAVEGEHGRARGRARWRGRARGAAPPDARGARRRTRRSRPRATADGRLDGRARPRPGSRQMIMATPAARARPWASRRAPRRS